MSSVGSKRKWGSSKKRFFKKVKKSPSVAVKRYSRIPKSVSGMVHQFAQTVVSTAAITSTITTPLEVNFVFLLSALPQAAQFTSLFDTYRIDRIELSLQPRSQVNYSSATTQAWTASLYTAIDYDDTGSLGSGATLLSNIQQFENVVVQNSVNPRKITMTPKVAASVYQNSISTFAYSQPKSGVWLDCAYPSVVHYGVRTVLGPTGANGDIVIDAVIRYIVSFKNVR